MNFTLNLFLEGWIVISIFFVVFFTYRFFRERRFFISISLFLVCLIFIYDFVSFLFYPNEYGYGEMNYYEIKKDKVTNLFCVVLAYFVVYFYFFCYKKLNKNK